MSSVVIRKNGGFYCVYGKDCFIFYYLFGYKIIDDKVGFPKSAYNKVLNTLDDNRISYEIKDVVFANYKKRNNYDKFIKLGKRKHSLDFRIKEIISKLEQLEDKDIDKILEFIESFYE